MSFAKRLANMKSAWKETEAAKSSGALPAGRYQFKIEAARMEEGKFNFNKGHLLICYECSVATGPMKGRKTWIRVDLESDGNKGKYPTGIAIWKGHLDTLEIDMPKQLTENAIKATLLELKGLLFDGACVHNAKGYPNVYINGLVNAPNEEEDDEEEEEDEEEVEEDEDEDEESDDDDDEEDEEDEEDFKVKKTTKKAPVKKAPAKKASKKKAEPEEEEDDDDDDDEDWSDDDFDDED